ncbi:MAG: UDP-N-acetylmuramoyl-tripeptide--D-alanyl-D-alanine ligase [Armatimonadetes bacterium]|nr:UDP-N-acetylmuramoyl-tripeptide--D-alanyl-D-alanine ligase [Armatimonadota bacterium]
MQLTLDEVLKATGGFLRQPGALSSFKGVSIDSRQVRPGELFIALKGEKFDGHDFLSQSLESGAAGIIVDRDPGILSPLPGVVQVGDTVTALGDLARWHRRKFDVPVVAVTGSTGKTTTKEFVSAAVSGRFSVLAARASFNNEVGVPLTLLSLDETHQAVVLEFAMRGEGQIRYLAEMAEPTIGVITNIGESHVGRLGSVEAIARAKGEIFEGMRHDGLAVLNADDPFHGLLRSLARTRIVSYGVTNPADCTAREIEYAWQQSGNAPLHCETSFVVCCGGETLPFRLPVCGRHFLANALAAVAVARSLGLSLAEISEGLEHNVLLPKRRQQWLRAPGGFLILDDAYNSSPASVRAALEVIREAPVQGRRIAVLGDIKELGQRSEQLHEEVGGELGNSRIDLVVCVGDYAGSIAAGAQRSGLSDECVAVCRDNEEATAAVREWVSAGDLVLVKGSRAMQLEEVVEGLMSDFGREGAHATE